MSNINKKGIWTTSTFHELYGENITQLYGTTNSYVPSTGTNRSITPYYIEHNDFELGEVMRIIVQIDYEGFDTSNTSGTFNMYFQGGKRTQDGSTTWTNIGINEPTTALQNYQNLKDLVLSQTKGSFIYSTTFIVSEDHYNNFYGCNLGIRSDYSNGIGRITMYKPIIFPDKYFIDINAIVKQSDNYLSCNEIIEY